ncbi:MBL fold metallo-hydrolase [Fulvimarina sp. MAC8]|uniref:MBL fold metallo-hydrolase n=1 Tax=Fulvimarina sp. MAC8 TaxID=3162874 RepID=UPI0032EE0FFA
MTTTFLCTACGTQYPPSDAPPKHCPICEDHRQFVPPAGQSWVSFEAMRAGRRFQIAREGEFLSLSPLPAFGIGNRAFLVRTPHGNLLWDCVPCVDDAIVEIIEGLGGLAGIAISHPHYYSAMAEWSAAFGDIPVHIHADEEKWVMRRGSYLDAWQGERRELLPGVTMIRCGGHFAGASVLHVAMAHDGKGALMVGDVLQVTPGCDKLGFMRSYPNFIPLGEKLVRRIGRALEGVEFDGVYGAFWDRSITDNGRAIMEASIERHIEWLHCEDDT